ncbi:hypothetical protein [Rhodanobacter umsongensis]
MKPHHRRHLGRLPVATRVSISGRIDDKQLDTPRRSSACRAMPSSRPACRS